VRLQDQVALITGGTRGIGRGIADAFLAEGARVVVTGRSAAKGEQALREMAAGERARFARGDATRREDVERWVAETLESFGRIDVLVNNAGGASGFAPVVDLTEEAWQETATWILHSAFWATRAALKSMLARRRGRIINISSLEGRQANKSSVAHYITFKHAMNGFTKAVAFEAGPAGVTCNAILPGAVETDLMKEAGPAAAEALGISYEQYKANYAREAAIGRIVTVEEIAAVAVLLASDAGAGITGALIAVDGGSAL
jgi:3-hydroxybutyrate dehydrogenase/3-oxoacyl-[acyl-carrier protein] reductase